MHLNTDGKMQPRTLPGKALKSQDYFLFFKFLKHFKNLKNKK